MKKKKNLRLLAFIFAGLFFLLAAGIIVLPWLLRDKIIERAKAELNKYLNAEVDFSDVNISLIRNFPYASVRFEDFYISGKDEFVNDTLIFSKNIDLSINLKSLFSDTGYDIRKMEFNDSKVVVRVLEGGRANWKIMKTDSTATTDTSDMNFHWKLKSFVINNADIYYLYEKGDMDFILKNVNHSTTGDLTADSSLLVTRTSCDSLSFIWDGIAYVHNAQAELIADIDANLNDMIFKISRNSSKLNALPFSIVGWLQSIPEGWDMDFKLNAGDVDFKSLLSVIPAMYSESFADLKTGGEVDISGIAKGKWVGDFYPAFDFGISTKNAWFQYPALPSRLENINVEARIQNPGRTLDDTQIDISNFSFMLGGNPFRASLSVSQPVSDPAITLNAVGKLNTSYIAKIYPLDEKTNIQGMLDMNLEVYGRKSWFSANQYDKFRFNGFLNAGNVLLQTSMLAQKTEIPRAELKFSNRFAEISQLQVKYGQNDLNLYGRVENFIGYLLYDSELKGQLKASSQYLNMNDFLTEDNSGKSKNNATPDSIQPAMKTIVIPANINMTIDASVEKLTFAEMLLSQSKASLSMGNRQLQIHNLSTDAFGGKMKMSANYNSTDTIQPSLQMKINLDDVVFKQIFSQVETLRKYVPVFEKASGEFSAGLLLNTKMGAGMSPVLQTLNGDGSLSAGSISIDNLKVLETILKAVKKNEVFPVEIDEAGMTFEFVDGKMITKPFSLKLWDTWLTLSGITGYDKTINYNGKIQLPDKYKLGRLSIFNVSIGGTFSKPTVKVDLFNTVNEIVKETVEKVETAIVEKIEDVKDAAIEQARKEKEKAIALARIQADRIIKTAAEQGDKLIAEAKKQGDKLIEQTTNPITKAIAKAAAAKLIEEAQEKADALNQKAQEEAQKLIDKASEKTDF
ncbi:MAG: hypothetical protein KA177_04480 [Paludibacter sp.]|nr:hypothetical protein [Paludibacter sp.]